jgi:hypothetical protein
LAIPPPTIDPCRVEVQRTGSAHARDRTMFASTETDKSDRQPLGSYARHYYDLYQVSGHPEVQIMLRSTEYATIKADYIFAFCSPS